MRSSPDRGQLQAQLGYSFAEPDLLEQALTHVSALPPSSVRRIDSYQRLEFLGDRVLGLAVADMLYAAFPHAEEGELSRRLAALVRKGACAEVARRWGLDKAVCLGDGEAQTGGAKKVAILGDVCESVIGAVYLDGGYQAASTLVHSAFEPLMRDPGRSLRDPKTSLQEWAQKRGLPPPLYKEVARSGPDHAPIFIIEALVQGFASAAAEGGSKRIAEQASAQKFLERENGGLD